MKKQLLSSFFISSIFLSSISFAGEITGAKSFTDTLIPHTFNYFTFHFKKNEVAEVKVVGDSKSNLDCVLRSSGGEVIAEDNDATDICFFAPFILNEDNYTLTVSNKGENSSTFSIEVN